MTPKAMPDSESSTAVGDKDRVSPVSGLRSTLLPVGACDTHVHIFDPSLGQYGLGRAYTPASATLDDLCTFSASLSNGDRHASFVLVQPSPYGTDNSVLLSVLAQCRNDNSFVRGIAVVDIENIGHDELFRMHQLGVRGLRLNMQASGQAFEILELERMIKQAASLIKGLPNWKLQLFAPAHVWTGLYSTILNLPVVVIADHTGGLLGPSKLDASQTDHPTLQAGFESLVALAKKSRVLIKISGLYRSSLDTATDHADMAPIIDELAKQVPDSLIWGSDWPHTGEGKDRLRHADSFAVEPFRAVDNAAILRNIRQWVGNDKIWYRMTVENPRRAFT